ncbi:hypothetical protein ACCO45_011301 [Purpureocillium lilacinum]|uniref:Uncharacterized protein n=1 Tax=Purpureocillium lilacinum TaxID=33203 RepID=A0ACC4DI12_PURLI
MLAVGGGGVLHRRSILGRGPEGSGGELPTTETWADGLDLVWSVVKPFSTVDDKAGAGELRDDLAAKPAVSHREMEPREARPTQNRLGGRSRSPDATDTLLRKYNQAPPAERNVYRPRCYPRPCDMPRRLRIHLVQCARREEPGAAWQKISVWVTLGAGLAGLAETFCQRLDRHGPMGRSAVDITAVAGFETGVRWGRGVAQFGKTEANRLQESRRSLARSVKGRRDPCGPEI